MSVKSEMMKYMGSMQQAAYIRPEILGSDHCPVGLELAL